MRTNLRKFWIILLATALVCLWWISPHYQAERLEVWMLDVGQGESVLVREPGGKLLLFDGGPDDSVLEQLGAILPPWQHRIDLVVLSHNHSDHITGLLSVFERYQIGSVWISGATENSAEYRQFVSEIKEYHIPTQISYFHTEQCLQAVICPIPIPFGQTTLQIYHPFQDMTGITPPDQHDATVSVKISYGQESVFLTGDLNEGHEQDMLNACQAPRCTLHATVLQIPHHGSATGLLPAFLSAVAPRAGLIPVGLHNKFGHPKQQILAKLQAANVPYWRTDLNGRIHVVLDGKQELNVVPEHPG